MGEFSRKKFKSLAIRARVVNVSDVPKQLSNDGKSNIYFDWRPLTNDEIGVKIVAGHVASFIESRRIAPQCVIGVPNSARDLGIETQKELMRRHPEMKPLDHPFLIAEKSHMEVGMLPGLALDSEGKYAKKPQKAIVLDNTITTGFSTARLVAKLREKGIDVTDVVCLTKRNGLTPMPGLDDQEKINELKNIFKEHSRPRIGYNKALTSSELFESLGIRFHSMSDDTELIGAYLSIHKLDEKRLTAINKEYALDWGSRRLKEAARPIRADEKSLPKQIYALLQEPDPDAVALEPL
ncbi:MAG: hypothetical protein KGH49_00270 [Candidatus Micrarchaeota archaeon]|nr:hypothetical protein [Candidatus Micrarchaeota archaeon]